MMELLGSDFFIGACGFALMVFIMFASIGAAFVEVGRVIEEERRHEQTSAK